MSRTTSDFAYRGNAPSNTELIAYAYVQVSGFALAISFFGFSVIRLGMLVPFQGA